MIRDFYATRGAWASTYRLVSLDELRVLDAGPGWITATPMFLVCAAYHYAPLPGTNGQAGQEVGGFIFGLDANGWNISGSSGFNGWPSMDSCVAKLP